MKEFERFLNIVMYFFFGTFIIFVILFTKSCFEYREIQNKLREINNERSNRTGNTGSTRYTGKGY